MTFCGLNTNSIIIVIHLTAVKGIILYIYTPMKMVLNHTF